jgi:hypothetical protein
MSSADMYDEDDVVEVTELDNPASESALKIERLLAQQRKMEHTIKYLQDQVVALGTAVQQKQLDTPYEEKTTPTPKLQSVKIQTPQAMESVKLQTEQPATPALDSVKLQTEQPVSKLQTPQPATPALDSVKLQTEQPATPALASIKLQNEQPVSKLQTPQPSQPATPALDSVKLQISQPATPALDSVKLQISQPATPALDSVKLQISQPATPALESIKLQISQPATPALESIKLQTPQASPPSTPLKTHPDLDTGNSLFRDNQTSPPTPLHPGKAACICSACAQQVPKKKRTKRLFDASEDAPFTY